MDLRFFCFCSFEARKQFFARSLQNAAPHDFNKAFVSHDAILPHLLHDARSKLSFRVPCAPVLLVIFTLEPVQLFLPERFCFQAKSVPKILTVDLILFVS